MLKSFSTALSFLTVIRPPFTPSVMGPAELAASFSCFPLVGLWLGLIYMGAAALLGGLVPALLLATGICALTVVLTRGLHLDGLADLGDGIWGGATPERRLAIMKDSHIGSFGVLALVLAVCFKIAAIHGLLSANHLKPLLLAPVFARFAMVAAALGSTYARKEGLGKPFLEHVRTQHLVMAAIFCILPAAAAGPLFPAYFIPVLGAVIFFRFISTRFLGGMTGDVLGALSETTEIIVLALGACSA
ncbi:MAG: adenosylcobinamide-GDP ribazoletransferase [Syntrophobacteraceae bacterium]